MMKPPYLALALATVVATSTGCSSWLTPARPAPVSAGDPVAARLLDAEVARKMQAHTMSEDVKAPPPVLIGPVVTIDKYQGDAAILLKRIAAANGKAFEIIGTEPRLPLFVHVHAVNKDLRSVLADIGSQFGGRADLVLTPSHIQIQYKRAKTL